MPKTLRHKTLRDVHFAEHFLSLSSGIDLGTSSLECKRAILAECYGQNGKLDPYRASERQIYAVFLSIHERASHTVSDYHRDPVPFFLATERVCSPDESLKERVAIMLDSCSDERLFLLTDSFGPATLGDYARYPLQPKSL